MLVYCDWANFLFLYHCSVLYHHIQSDNIETDLLLVLCYILKYIRASQQLLELEGLLLFLCFFFFANGHMLIHLNVEKGK